MLIDCDTCTVRGDACGGCLVTVMLGQGPGPVYLDDESADALGVLAEGGLVPELRLTRGAAAG